MPLRTGNMLCSISKIEMNDKQAARSFIQQAVFLDGRWSIGGMESGTSLVEMNTELKFDGFAFTG